MDQQAPQEKKPNKLIFLLPAIVMISLGALFFLRLEQMKAGDAPDRLDSVLIDRPVPEFQMEPLPGRGMPLWSEHLKGEVSLVNIFGSWCVGCVAEHPYLMKIKESGLVPIHGINWRDDPTQGMAWLQKHGDPYERVGSDPKPSRVAIDFGTYGAPETFIVDKAGVIRYRHAGPVTEQIFQKVLLPKIQELRAR